MGSKADIGVMVDSLWSGPKTKWRDGQQNTARSESIQECVFNC